ncbi:MAG: GNAT family N-acetyltransferase [Bacteroidetes bacterium]|nr:GNAT family N-acetyltransferase [Bacteroidota bacterium]
MKIERINSGTIQAFEEAALKYGKAFVHPVWLSLYDSGIQRYGIFDDGSKLVGGFILQEKSFPGGVFYKTLPFTPHNGLFINNLSKNNATRIGYEKKILEAMAILLERPALSIKSFSFPQHIIDFQPFIWNHYKVNPRYTYIIDLSQPVGLIRQNLAGERRNDLNKADKDQVFSKKNDDPAKVVRLIMNSFARNKAEISHTQVERIVNELTEKGLGFSYTAYWQEKPVATAYCIFDRETAYYILGGYDEKNRHKGAGAQALWLSILHAQELGLGWFDFEGSMIPPVEHYFRGFGGQIIPFFTVNKAPFLVECILKIMKRSQF